MVLLNRSGGTAAADEGIAAKVEAALSAAGIAAEIRTVDGGDIAGLSRTAVERGDALLIVGGGDGSIGAAAGALADSATRLGILPLGTRNHFARDLGIPLGLGEAGAVISGGSERRVDLADLNGRAFINNSAIGIYPLMVADRDAQQQRLHRGKRAAMAVALIRILARFGHHRLALRVNGQTERLVTPLLFVGNNDYRIELPGAGTRERLDAGILCVLVMRSKSRAGFIAAALRALAGRARADDLVRLEDVEQLRVDSARTTIAVSLDGEVLRIAPPLDYRIRKQALRVIAP